VRSGVCAGEPEGGGSTGRIEGDGKASGRGRGGGVVPKAFGGAQPLSKRTLPPLPILALPKKREGEGEGEELKERVDEGADEGTNEDEEEEDEYDEEEAEEVEE
jgi:hypothetical protein